MAFIPEADFFFEVSAGRIAGHKAVIVGGHNPDIDSGVAEDLWEQGGILVPLSSAERMNLVSTSVSDDGSPGGTGARTVKIAGLSNSNLEISEIVTTDGTTNVLTTLSYRRVRLLEVASAGITETNVGAITAMAETAGTVQCEISPEHGVSQNSHYTVPAGKTSFVLGVQLFVTKTSGGMLPLVDFIFQARLTGVKLNPIRFKLDTAVDSLAELSQVVSNELLATTDIWIEVESDQNNTDVHTRMYIIQVDN